MLGTGLPLKLHNGSLYLEEYHHGLRRAIVKKGLTPVERCAIETMSAGHSSASQLKLENMLGILTVHAAGVFTALVFHFLQGAPKAVRKGIQKSRTLGAIRRVSPGRRGSHQSDEVSAGKVAAWVDTQHSDELR